MATEFKPDVPNHTLPLIPLPGNGAVTELGGEGYELEITPAGEAHVRAETAAGRFYGEQTLRQLAAQGPLPPGRIVDRPRFRWRGLMLDVARHYRSVSFIKRRLDVMAVLKLNRLHLHLVDDQGWRLEIKRYPGLTDIGSRRPGQEGFYTQDEIRELVAYAAERFITVVPEIEMPGHCLAALAAYPELSCTGGPFAVKTSWGITPDVYCAGNEAVFAYLENVLEEVLALFPGTFVHIGGDECLKDRWKACPKCQARMKAEGLRDEHELQSWFVRRMERWLNGRGRRLIGWDEILEGGLAPNATVMSWRGMQGGIAAAQAGHDVIMTPASNCYLDYDHELLPLEKAYAFEPVPEAVPMERILGLQGNLWSEFTPTEQDVDRQVFPRLCALAEVAWSPAEKRDWADFQKRLPACLEVLRQSGVITVKTYLTVTPPGPVTDRVELDIRWTVDTGGVPARNVKVALSCDGVPVGAEESLDLVPDQIVNRRIRFRTTGLHGEQTFILSVSVGGQPLPAVARAVTVLPSATRSPRLIGGAWVGLTHWNEDEGRYWNRELSQFTADDWRELVRGMKALGMRTIIVQETWRNPVYYGRHYHQMTAENYRETYAGRAYYPSRLWPGRVELPCGDPVDTILDEADKQGMRVFLGVGLYAHFDYTAGSLAWHRDVMRELWAMYRRHDSLHGWYVSEELSGPVRPHEQRYGEATDQFRAEVKEFFRSLHDTVRTLAPHTLLMVAPDSNFSAAADVWREVVRHCDIVCVQVYYKRVIDGVPAEEAIRRMQAWCDAAGCHHWLDMELFGFEHPDKPGPHREGCTRILPDGTEQWEPSPLIPLPMAALREELARLDSLEYACAYQYPGLLCAPGARLKPGGEPAERLYRDYQAYVSARNPAQTEGKP